MFRDFTNYENDPIEGLFVRLAEDTSSEKIDLGIGVYRDRAGRNWILFVTTLLPNARTFA